jgi:shikimate dehydrogenase
MPGKLKRSCVIGWPVDHSRSPLIHNYWLKLHGLEGEYTREAVPPEDLEGFLRNLQELGYVGCNVTVPHKESAARLVALADMASRRLGAVNTLFFDNSTLMGANTDGFGFTANLKSTVPGFDPADGRAMIIGAGGAARAIVDALLRLNIARVYICNRSIDRAKAVAASFGPKITPVAWEHGPAALKAVDLLVNATSLGMKGQPELTMPIDELPGSAVVCDIVYVPLETALLRNARARGLRTVDGLGMLLHQARPAFEKWFGQKPEVTAELRQLLERDILSKAGT